MVNSRVNNRERAVVQKVTEVSKEFQCLFDRLEGLVIMSIEHYNVTPLL